MNLYNEISRVIIRELSHLVTLKSYLIEGKYSTIFIRSDPLSSDKSNTIEKWLFENKYEVAKDWKNSDSDKFELQNYPDVILVDYITFDKTKILSQMRYFLDDIGGDKDYIKKMVSLLERELIELYGINPLKP